MYVDTNGAVVRAMFLPVIISPLHGFIVHLGDQFVRDDFEVRLLSADKDTVLMYAGKHPPGGLERETIQLTIINNNGAKYAYIRPPRLELWPLDKKVVLRMGQNRRTQQGKRSRVDIIFVPRHPLVFLRFRHPMFKEEGWQYVSRIYKDADMVMRQGQEEYYKDHGYNINYEHGVCVEESSGSKIGGPGMITKMPSISTLLPLSIYPEAKEINPKKRPRDNESDDEYWRCVVCTRSETEVRRHVIWGCEHCICRECADELTKREGDGNDPKCPQCCKRFKRENVRPLNE